MVLGLSGLAAEEKGFPLLNMGMSFGLNYCFISEELSFWNFNYGLGLDGMFHLTSGFFLGFQTGLALSFHKPSLLDPVFDELSVGFPFELILSVWLDLLSLQFSLGLWALATASKPDGIYLVSDFDFKLYPALGVKFGFGTATNLSLGGGYIFGEKGFFYTGLSLRIGLF